MVESVVLLQENPSRPSTAGNQAISPRNAEHGPLRPPSATYQSRKEIEPRAISAATEIDDPINARPGSHNREKEPFERHSHPSHILPYNHSWVTHVGHEDYGDHDGPKDQALWILVGNPNPRKISSH